MAHYNTVNGRWAFIRWDEGSRVIRYVDDADNATFRQLDDPEYAADKNSVYRYGSRIKNAEPSSFRHISGIFWRDSQRVFVEGWEIPSADPETFLPFSISPWARDKRDAYQGQEPVHVEDLATFRPINSTWAKDARAYYAGLFPAA